MRDSKRDAQPDFEFDDGILPPKIRWHGSTIEVKAQLVPGYGWSTASIDVFLDGRCILRTGGEPKVTGSSRAEFDHDGERHIVELSWEKVRGLEFPYLLRIDDAKVALAGVPIENAPLSVIPWLVILVSLLIWVFLSTR